QCSVGRYGPDCQYQCHCAGSDPCDKDNGSCSSGCHQDWFGPACQYESIGFKVLENSALDWLTDQNDTTCNDDKETPVYLTLKSPIPLGWSRIVVSSPARLRHIELHYYIANKNDTNKCPGPKVNLSSTVQDILCPTADNVTKFKRADENQAHMDRPKNQPDRYSVNEALALLEDCPEGENGDNVNIYLDPP
ncbi:hypothetical protein RRG08_016698, partial [Elysia crispata]